MVYTYTPLSSVVFLGILFTVSVHRVAGDALECDPVDREQINGECDNTLGTLVQKCSFSPNTGVIQTIDGKWVDVTDEAELKNLSETFGSKLGISNVTGYNWNQNAPATFAKPDYKILHFEVNPGIRARYQQVVGYCALYIVRTTRILRSDYDVNGNIINS